MHCPCMSFHTHKITLCLPSPHCTRHRKLIWLMGSERQVEKGRGQMLLYDSHKLFSFQSISHLFQCTSGVRVGCGLGSEGRGQCKVPGIQYIHSIYILLHIFICVLRCHYLKRQWRNKDMKTFKMGFLCEGNWQLLRSQYHVVCPAAPYRHSHTRVWMNVAKESVYILDLSSVWESVTNENIIK